MKKAIILGVMAFFAINIAGIQNANAQVNKLREQYLQASNETDEPSDQVKPNKKISNVQKINAVNKQREQMIQAANETDESNNQVKPDIIMVNMPDMINELGINQDARDLVKANTEQKGKTLKNKKLLVKQIKRVKTEQQEKQP